MDDRAHVDVCFWCLSLVAKVILSDLFGFYFKTIINSDKLACSHPSDIYWHCRRVKLSRLGFLRQQSFTSDLISAIPTCVHRHPLAPSWSIDRDHSLDRARDLVVFTCRRWVEYGFGLVLSSVSSPGTILLLLKSTTRQCKIIIIKQYHTHEPPEGQKW